MKLIFEDLIEVLKTEFNLNYGNAASKAQNVEAKLRVMQRERLSEETKKKIKQKDLPLENTEENQSFNYLRSF